MAEQQTTLYDLLSNHIILRQTAPYLPLLSVLRLSATSASLRDLVLSNQDAFSRLDLRGIAAARLPPALLDSPLDRGGQAFRAARMDEALTEDEFYCGPLRGIFGRLDRGLGLGCVRTMLLDGLCVPADLVREIIAEDRFAALRILSLRRCEHLNERKLCQVLRYAVRPGRAKGTPRLRGLYVFGPRDEEVSRTISVAPSTVEDYGLSIGVTLSEGAQIGGLPSEQSTKDEQHLAFEDPWWRQGGEVMKPPLLDWAGTLEACKNIISFDAVLCRGPQHDATIAGLDWLGPSIANISVGGCAGCGSCPEGPATFEQHDECAFPLLAPPPLHSVSLKAARQPRGVLAEDGKVCYPPLILRCNECLRNRRCNRCNKWWCESCYQIPRPARQAPEARAGVEQWMDMDMQVKVYFNVCVETCLRSEILPVVDGMWG